MCASTSGSTRTIRTLVDGASPARAAQFQPVVLAGTVLPTTVTGVVVTHMADRALCVPGVVSRG